MRKTTVVTAFLCAAGLLAAGCARVSEVETVTPERPSRMLIADFDAGGPPNMLGGDYGAWDKDPDDETQSAEIFFEEEKRMGDTGYSLGVKYDVDSPNPAFNGFWMSLAGSDFSDYDYLVISVKGDSEKGFTNRFKVELKNDAGQTGTYMVSGVTDEWQEIEIPLNMVRGIRDFSVMEEFVIVFEDAVASPKEGVIYIDNICVR